MPRRFAVSVDRTCPGRCSTTRTRPRCAPTSALLTVARFASNVAYRFAAPFLATIATGLDVSLGRLGVATGGRRAGRPCRRRSSAGSSTRTAAAAGDARRAGRRRRSARWSPGSSSELWLFVVGLSSSRSARWLRHRARRVDRRPGPVAARSRVTGLTEIAWSTGPAARRVSSLGLRRRRHLVARRLPRRRRRRGRLPRGLLRRRLPRRARRRRRHARRRATTPAAGRRWRASVPTAVCVAGLAGSAQFMFVTYGSWLDDHFGFSAADLAAVTFGLRVVELVSGVVSMRSTDRWGKERSIVIGSSLMAPGRGGRRLRLAPPRGCCSPAFGAVPAGLRAGDHQLACRSARCSPRADRPPAWPCSSPR